MIDYVLLVFKLKAKIYGGLSNSTHNVIINGGLINDKRKHF